MWIDLYSLQICVFPFYPIIFFFFLVTKRRFLFSTLEDFDHRLFLRFYRNTVDSKNTRPGVCPSVNVTYFLINKKLTKTITYIWWTYYMMIPMKRRYVHVRHGRVGCSIMNPQCRKHFECGRWTRRFACAKKSSRQSILLCYNLVSFPPHVLRIVHVRCISVY